MFFNLVFDKFKFSVNRKDYFKRFFKSITSFSLRTSLKANEIKILKLLTSTIKA